MAIHPPLSQWLIEQVGWRQAWIWLGVSTWILMMPIIFFLLQDAPESVGLLPDGEKNIEHDNEKTVNKHGADFGFTLKEALATSTFYIVAAALCTMSMLVTALHFFQVSIFAHQGLTPSIAAWMFPLSACVAVLLNQLLGNVWISFRHLE